MVEAVACVSLATGSFFVFVSALGLLRLPDVYSRLHAVTKASTLGLAGILTASVATFWTLGHWIVPELVTMLFVFLTNPAGGHMIARSAYLIGVPMTRLSVLDDMRRAGESSGADHDRD